MIIEASCRGFRWYWPPSRTPPPNPPTTLSLFYEPAAVVEIQSPTGGCEHSSCLFSIFSLILTPRPSVPPSLTHTHTSFYSQQGSEAACYIHSLIAHITFSDSAIFYLKKKNWLRVRVRGSCPRSTFGCSWRRRETRDGKYGGCAEQLAHSSKIESCH